MTLLLRSDVYWQPGWLQENSFGTQSADDLVVAVVVRACAAELAAAQAACAGANGGDVGREIVAGGIEGDAAGSAGGGRWCKNRPDWRR